jgi:hypothetical protein
MRKKEREKDEGKWQEEGEVRKGKREVGMEGGKGRVHTPGKTCKCIVHRGERTRKAGRYDEGSSFTH